LGERLDRTQEVGGSSPPSSTAPRTPQSETRHPLDSADRARVKRTQAECRLGPLFMPALARVTGPVCGVQRAARLGDQPSVEPVEGVPAARACSAAPSAIRLARFTPPSIRGSVTISLLSAVSDRPHVREGHPWTWRASSTRASPCCGGAATVEDQLRTLVVRPSQSSDARTARRSLAGEAVA
jgi:hypothetical protein